MSPINERAFHYLIEEQHTTGELLSFSLERGKESIRTMVANIFRGNEKRCLELVEECDKIYKDKNRVNSLSLVEIKNLMRNSGNLRDEFEKGTENYEKADRVFQEILKEYRKKDDYIGI